MASLADLYQKRNWLRRCLSAAEVLGSEHAQRAIRYDLNALGVEIARAEWRAKQTARPFSDDDLSDDTEWLWNLRYGGGA
jgi:hypothetical protein